jgi:cyclic pyranopterin phosphate synthase
MSDLVQLRPKPSFTLRVSLLDQCQFRCPYCLPGSVDRFTNVKSWLRPDEHAWLAERFVERGVRKVRFTGGEPLLRPDVVEVARAWAGSGVELALTTNGEHLGDKRDALREAGVTRVSVHIDSLKPDRYRRLMGDADVEAIIDEVEAAARVFDEVKINCVVQRGQNDDELGDFLDLSRARGVQVRFIELMNTGSAPGYVDEVFMTGAQITDAIRAERGAREIPRRHKSDPASLWETGDGTVFGLIASDTQPFCDACDRLRITADGRVRGCLYEPGGSDLRVPLRAGGEAQVERILDELIGGKRSYHPSSARARRPFSMADVGG